MRILRFIKALYRYILYGKRVDFNIYVNRLSICNKCGFLNTDNWTCLRCGCYLTKKCKLSTEKCPLNKWNSEG